MIFISYSSKDAKTANTLCAGLEKKDLSCWIAPRDINPGENYPSAIMRGIDNAKIMIIIISDNSVMSKYVLNEVEQAFKRDIAIIPLRVDDAEPTGDLNFFLSLTQWVDAASGNMAPHVERLADQIKGLLSGVKIAPPPPVEPRKSKKLPMMLGALAVLAGIAFWANYDPSPAIDPLLAQYTEAKKLHDVVPNNKLTVTGALEPSKGIYTEGEKVVIGVSVDKPAWIVVLIHSSDGNKTLLYPNDHAQMRKLNTNEAIKLGAEGSGFEFEISEPYGTDLIQIIASQRREELMEFFDGSDAMEGTNLRGITLKALANATAKVSSRGIKVRQEAALKDEGWGKALVALKTIKNK